MGIFKKRVKNLIESLIGYKIVQFGSKSIALIDKKREKDSWFLYHTQIRKIFLNSGINLVLDVGANEGQFAQRLRSFYYDDIFSFEPVLSAFEKLSETSSSDPKWYVFRLALGDEEVERTINVPDNTTFSSLLKTNDYCLQRFGDSAKSMKKEVVLIKRIDKLLENIVPDIENKKIFLKMDTQGYDIKVFKGLGKKLKHVVAIQSELSLIPIYEKMPHWTESICNFENDGFYVAGMFPVNWDLNRIIECDCLLVKKE